MVKQKIRTLEFRNLDFQLDDGRTLFSQMNFEFPMNEVVWIRGESGAGKSVLAKILAGLIMPTSGDYLVNKKQVNEMSFEEFLPYRCNMGYSFDFGGLINNRDIIGNLLLATEYHDFEIGDPDLLAKRVMNYMRTFNLQKVAYQRPSAIVGGLRKAACVARAFIHEPQVLILDDPTTGLRGDTASRLKDLILLKRATGEIQHVLIASEDTEFMRTLNPVTVEIHHGHLRYAPEEAAA